MYSGFSNGHYTNKSTLKVNPRKIPVFCQYYAALAIETRVGGQFGTEEPGLKREKELPPDRGEIVTGTPLKRSEVMVDKTSLPDRNFGFGG